MARKRAVRLLERDSRGRFLSRRQIAARKGALTRRLRAANPTRNREVGQRNTVRFLDRAGKLLQSGRFSRIEVRTADGRRSVVRTLRQASEILLPPTGAFDIRDSRTSRRIIERMTGLVVRSYSRRNGTLEDLMSSRVIPPGLDPTKLYTVVVTFRGETIARTGTLRMTDKGPELIREVLGSLGRLTDAERARLFRGPSRVRFLAAAMGTTTDTLSGRTNRELDSIATNAGLPAVPLKVQVISIEE